mmetsp:Transcript_72357/g.195657  ORF Transcript_72357/g.195657 Transcript_72357/m.195657 type:complete len:299 (-) Transcript_72357:1853-2749(-)
MGGGGAECAVADRGRAEQCPGNWLPHSRRRPHRRGGRDKVRGEGWDGVPLHRARCHPLDVHRRLGRALWQRGVRARHRRREQGGHDRDPGVGQSIAGVLDEQLVARLLGGSEGLPSRHCPVRLHPPDVALVPCVHRDHGREQPVRGPEGPRRVHPKGHPLRAGPHVLYLPLVHRAFWMRGSQADPAGRQVFRGILCMAHQGGGGLRRHRLHHRRWPHEPHVGHPAPERHRDGQDPAHPGCLRREAGAGAPAGARRQRRAVRLRHRHRTAERHRTGAHHVFPYVLHVREYVMHCSGGAG